MRSKMPSMAEQIAGRCKHFTGFGLMEETSQCKCGVVYRALVGGTDLGWVRRAPCLRRNEEPVECAKREFPTKEEVEAEAQEAEAHTAATIKGMTLCAADSESRGFAKGEKGAKGEVKCPACGGTLCYSRSSYNGHIWGRCKTADCLAWMQ